MFKLQQPFVLQEVIKVQIEINLDLIEMLKKAFDIVKVN